MLSATGRALLALVALSTLACEYRSGPGLLRDASAAPDSTDEVTVDSGNHVDAPAASPDTAPAGDSGLNGANGKICTGDGECVSGHCVDGRCCESACAGQCEACGEAGREGQCVAVMGAPRPNHKPCDGTRDVCRGTCNGSERTRCTYPGAEAQCTPGSCSAGMATTASVCNGAGACTMPSNMACRSNLCADTTKCAGGCGPTSPCPGGTYCDSTGACLPQKSAGASCQFASECSTGSCVDGVCCNGSCNGPCQACNVPGSPGQCSPVRSRDDDGCTGTCDASGACKTRLGDSCSPGAASACVSGFCVDGRCCAKQSCGTCESCTGGGGSCVQVTKAEDPDTCSNLQKCDATGKCANRFADFPVEGGPTIGITVGADGNIWFTARGNSKVGRMTVTGAATEFDASAKPQEIVRGPDGTMWFTEDAVDKIVRITETGTIVGEFSVPGLGAGSICLGPDNNVWFSEYNGNRIGRLTAAGMLKEFTIPTTNGGPYGIAPGPDGNIWFSEYDADKIGRITLSGTISEFAIPAGSHVNYLVAGPDGNVWYTGFGTNKIGKMTTAGTLLTEYTVPTPAGGPSGITVGPDQNVWFTEIGASKIARITTAGAITEFMLPPGNSAPFLILLGPDGNLWFSEANATGKVGRFTP